MDPSPVPLRLFGSASDAALLEWSWVEQQLTDAGTYWVVAPSPDHPHPRPVWGLWLDGVLLVSIGSPVLAREVGADSRVTVHLDSGTGVVIVEGRGATVTDAATLDRFLPAYNGKYDWNYTLDEYGPPTRIEPERVLAWRSGGWAGRDGFHQVGKWTTA